jgi:uncharacterized protein YbgA (DUF1722 family)/uncharacterized protein YbbK (DUF523 family)
VGEPVRFDGGHRRDRYVTDTIGELVTFVPVCPEMEIGLGAPRETLRLIDVGAGRRLVAPKSGLDHTESMGAWSRDKVAALAALDLSGYLLKKDSPTCGMERVKVYDTNDVPAKTGVGLFAEALARGAPLLPIEEDGRLHDPHLRENFFERVFGYRRLRDLFERAEPAWTVGDLVAFHTREKLLLMAHSQQLYKELGQRVANPHAMPREQLASEYQAAFMRALATLATVGRHVNVLQHMIGYVTDGLDEGDRAEMHRTVAEYQAGLVPLVVPLVLLRHHVRKQKVDYLLGQTYLEPHPKELMLRNHV